MGYRFETSHNAETVGVTLFDGANCIVWHADFERFQAQVLANLLREGLGPQTAYSDRYSVNVGAGPGDSVLVMIGDDGPYLRFKVLLTPAQAQDMASTIQMHVIASEYEGRPKDEAPMDDVLPRGWAPEGEAGGFGRDEEDDDPSERWKRGL